jgi:hypothetical protein
VKGRLQIGRDERAGFSQRVVHLSAVMARVGRLALVDEDRTEVIDQLVLLVAAGDVRPHVDRRREADDPRRLDAFAGLGVVDEAEQREVKRLEGSGERGSSLANVKRGQGGEVRRTGGRLVISV